MPNIVYVAVSVDGYLAREDGGIDWLNEIPNTGGSDYGFSVFLDRIDAIVMGRHTFETVVSFQSWPYTKPVFVPSNTLRQLPAGYENRAGLMEGDPRAITGSLNEQGYRTLYIDGGQTIHRFMQADLIDEWIITTVPILLGSGIPLFPQPGSELKLERVDAEVLSPFLVRQTYVRKHPRGTE